MRFENRTALVTGGSRGLGGDMALALARQGCDVFINYVSDQSREKAESVVAAIKQLGRRSEAFQLNVVDYDAVKSVVDRIIETEGKIDFLVNNAGINKDVPLMLMTPQEWKEVIDTNLTGTFNGCRAVIVPMMKQKYGRIVNMSSVTGLIGMAGQVNYGASKAGIIGLTKCLAKEVVKYNIRVNAVAPGFIQTEMLDKLNDEYKKKLIALIPEGRIGRSEEVSSVVSFLLSEESSYITGHVLPIDGGLAI